jgi:hypothetical protein
LREYHPTREVGVCVLGGFIGEVLLTFNALNDYILSNPNLSEFKLNAEKIEPFLVDWMKEAEFPEGTCVVKITQSAQAILDEMSLRSDEHTTVIAQQFANPISHESFGLKFLLNNSKNVQLNENVILEVFKAIAHVGS